MQNVAERAGGLSVRCQGLVHLYKTFEGHDVVALQGVDLGVEAGERVAFLGPSGSGKSTLLTLFGGIQRPSAGRIFLGDEEISRMSERQLTKVRASRVSTMLQGATRNLLHYATARQNLRFSRAASRRPRPQPSATPSCCAGSAWRRRRPGRADDVGWPAAAAGAGLRVTASPQLLLADEPTSQLSHEDRDHMLELIHGLGDEFGTTILVVTHQPEVAEHVPAHGHHARRAGRHGGPRRGGVRRGRCRGRRPPAGPRRPRVAAGHAGADRAGARDRLMLSRPDGDDESARRGRTP